MEVTKWLNSYVLPNATAPHLAKTGKAQCEHMFSASPLRADIAQCSRHVSKVPTGDIARARNERWYGGRALHDSRNRAHPLN